MPSASSTVDGDLGMFAIESRSPSTSFEGNDETTAHTAEDLHAIPAYQSPSSTAAAFTPTPQNPVSLPSFVATSMSKEANQVEKSSSMSSSRMGTLHNNGALSHSSAQFAPGSSLGTSSRFGAMSLQDEVSQINAPEPDLAASKSPAASHLIPRVDVKHVHNSSLSSSSSDYSMAVESPASEHRSLSSISNPERATTAALPQGASSSTPPSTAPPPSNSQRSIASASTITQARLPTSLTVSAMSVEQELDADHDLDSTSNSSHATDPRTRDSAVAARSSRRSRRSGVPPLQQRLPVGEGGPSAPPRNASFRDASNRLSVGAGHGDLGVDAYSPAGARPSSPSMTSFLDLDSPRTSDVGRSSRHSVPSRRTSLQATSPVTPTPPTMAGPASTSNPTSGSAAHPYVFQASSSRPGSSSSRAAPPAATPRSRPSTSRQNSGVPAITPLKLDREAMQRWVLSVGCVNFDLELGPDLEFLYPPLGISREERDNIAFSSFPDTSIFDDGSLVFSWRVREVPLDSSGSEPPTIKSLSDALQTSTGMDEETPRPSMNKAALQNAMAKAHAQKPASNSLSVPTSPTSPSTSGFRDSSASSTTSSNALSRQVSDANLQNASSAGSMPATTSFHERLTHKLFSSSGSTSMSRHFSHDRHSSVHSTSSATSTDDDPDNANNRTTSMVASNSSPGGSSLSLFTPKRTSTSSSYIYGYVFFRQKRDPTNRRGYFQKSVVILSHLPLVGLFSEVVARLGPLYFEHGMEMFEAFANDVMSWPAPQPGTILTLPLLGSIITAAIPFGQQPQNSPNAESQPMVASLSGASTNSNSGFRNTSTMTMRSRPRPNASNRKLPEPLIGPEGPLLASIPTTTLFETFKDALSDLWLLWECVLLAEPILVIAPEPKIASEAVWHMLDLIRPIPYAGDFRPYFHIHDYDFRTLVTKNKPQAGTLVASTNPFFATACGHWPHVLRVGKAAVKLIQIKHGTGGGSGGVGGKRVGGGMQGGGIGGGHGAGGGGPDHVPGFATKRKRRVSKDRQLLKRLQDLAMAAAKAGGDDAAIQAATQAANVTMRRYFADLTERFLSPLNRYVASLVPASFDLSSPSEVPKIRPFNTTDFLASLKAHGTPLAIRSRSLPTGASVRQSFYMDFLKCPNFSLWLHSRVAAAEEEQRRRYISSLLVGDVTTFGHTRGEIETIDLYSRLVEEIRLVDVQLTAPTEPGPGSRWRTDKPSATPQPQAQTQKREGSGRNTPTTSVGNASSATTTEKRLLDQKRKLMSQLEKLCQTLPDDLRSSLRRPN